MNSADIRGHTVTIFYAVLLLLVPSSIYSFFFIYLFFLNWLTFTSFILNKRCLSRDLALHGPQGCLNVTGLSGEEPGRKQGETAQTWQAFMTFPYLDSFFCHSWLCCSFAESCKINEQGVMSAAVPFFHSTWPKGSSDVFFPLSSVLKGSVQRKNSQNLFSRRDKRPVRRICWWWPQS